MNTPHQTGSSASAFNLFISHKVSEHGDAVRKLKRILTRDETLNDKLHIYVSTEGQAGVNWVEQVHEELDNAGLLLYIYCFSTPPEINEWCNYETGYYAKTSGRTNLVTLVPPGKHPPSPLQPYQRVELNEDGITKLLERIYVDEGIYPELFNGANKKTLEIVINEILTTFSTAQKPVALSPRLWITIRAKDVEPFRTGAIPLPEDSIISGETEAAKQFGYYFHGNEHITLAQLRDAVEIGGGLPHFYAVLSDTLRRILNRNLGPWQVPPVKVLSTTPPSMLVPGYMKEMANGDKNFEFIVTVPPLNFDYPVYGSLMKDAYNLFIVSWHFRWRIVEYYLDKFKSLLGGGDPAIAAAKEGIARIQVDLSAVLLDGHNRRLRFPGDVIRNFEGEDRKVIEQIVNHDTGLWPQIFADFQTACDEVNIGAIVECLEQMQNINKTCLCLTLKLLCELTDRQLAGRVLPRTVESSESSKRRPHDG